MFSVVFVVCVLTFHVTSLFLPLSVFMYTFGLSQGPQPSLPLRGWGVDLGELGTITQTYLSSFPNFTNNPDKHTTHPTSTCLPHTHTVWFIWRSFFFLHWEFFQKHLGIFTLQHHCSLTGIFQIKWYNPDAMAFWINPIISSPSRYLCI